MTVTTDPSAVFDYVVVGAGSAGCVLAHRLTEDPGVRVLLLEAGPADRSVVIHMPAAFAEPLKSARYNWYYHSEPEPYMEGRRMYCPRGRVLGGSSSINGMIFVRGHALDYEHWAQGGLREWSYAHVLPYFKRAETCARGADRYRGGDGPLYVCTGRLDNPLFDVYIEAGLQAGYPFTEDMNGYRQEGFGRMDMTVREGRRWSTASAYLRPALARPNLTVHTGALTTRVLFEGERAVGVEYVRHSHIGQARAEREVLLAGGAVNSPQLLMLSGVGDADTLQTLGIPVVAHLPGVGQNLQDHLEVYLQHACTQPVTLYRATKPIGRLKVGLQWLLARYGPGASNHFEAGAFFRTRDELRQPDIQHHFLPVAASYDGSSTVDTDGFQVHVGPMRPQSRGSVSLRSAKPQDPPRILFNYMQTEADRRDMREGLRLTREVLAQRAFDPYRGRELSPGDAVRSDADIDAFVRARAESAYHPVGTCRMGTDEDAVVDPAARVRGVEGLRVVDASLMPAIVSGNTNAATIMLAEKLADAIRGVAPLRPDAAPFYDGAGKPARRRETPARTTGADAQTP